MCEQRLGKTGTHLLTRGLACQTIIPKATWETFEYVFVFLNVKSTFTLNAGSSGPAEPHCTDAFILGEELEGQGTVTHSVCACVCRNQPTNQP